MFQLGKKQTMMTTAITSILTAAYNINNAKSPTLINRKYLDTRDSLLILIADPCHDQT